MAQPQITLKQLRYFVTAAKYLSFSRAAEELHISQPSISSAVSYLESVVGVSLFIRHHAQGLSLTNTGEITLQRARTLLADSESFVQFATSVGKDMMGELYMSAFSTFAHLLMPTLMHEFREKYPGVSLHCDECHQAELIEGIRQGEYDLAFGYDMEIAEDLDFIPLYAHSPYVVVSTEHPLANRVNVSLEELATQDMVILRWPMSREYFIGLFNASGHEPRIAHQVSSTQMARELVSQNFGFTLFNIPLQFSGSSHYPNLVSIPLSDVARPLVIGVISIKDVRLPPAAEAMRQFAMERSAEAAFGRTSDKFILDSIECMNDMLITNTRGLNDECPGI